MYSSTGSERSTLRNGPSHVIAGVAVDGAKGEVAAKVGVTGKLFVITVYPARAMHEIERIEALRKSIAIKRSVASFAAVDA